MIHIMGKTYEVIQDYRNGWNAEAFRERYSEVLERYDYVVGDWGYSQLRLKGFYKENNPKATKDSSIAGLQDYLNEYCNFGCAHFIVEKISNKAQQDKGQPDSNAQQDSKAPQESKSQQDNKAQQDNKEQ